MTPEQKARQDKIKANNAQLLLDNPMYQEAITAIKADCFEKFQRTKFKEKDERDELWRKLQTIDWFEQTLRRYVTTGKMHEPRFIDKIRSIG